MVSRSQLLELGVRSSAIDRALAAGRLHRIHRGVYAVGHTALSREARWLAAVLAAGPGAALSHRSGAHLWRLVDRSPAIVDVTTPGTPRRIEGVAVHRTRRLDAHDVTRWNGIPVTTPARTLVDLADIATDRELQRALHQAEILYSLAPEELRTEGRRGARRLRGPRDRTRSELERAFRRLADDFGIPEPERNVMVAGFEVDALWREQRLVVELDGWQFHRSRYQFELDRRRDAILARAGHRVLRFTDRQLTQRPHEVAATVVPALASAP